MRVFWYEYRYLVRIVGTLLYKYLTKYGEYVDGAMEEAESPLEWELQQMQSLQKLASLYGWEDDCPKYLQRVKLIHQEGEARMKASRASLLAASSRAPTAAALTGTGKAEKTAQKRRKPYGWQVASDFPKIGKRCSSHTTAMKLLGPAPYGSWMSDRDSPSGVDWRRYVAVDPNDNSNYCRARIQESKGKSR